MDSPYSTKGKGRGYVRCRLVISLIHSRDTAITAPLRRIHYPGVICFCFCMAELIWHNNNNAVDLWVEACHQSTVQSFVAVVLRGLALGQLR